MRRFFLEHSSLAVQYGALAAFRWYKTPGRLRLLPLLLAGFLFWGCQKEQQDPQALFHFQDSTQTNITFVNRLPEPGEDQLSILDYVDYYNGAGVAAGDIDNDGLVDLFFVSNRGENKLYLNKGKRPHGSFTFEDISQAAGIEGKADWQTGVTMVDINGDGWLDIYICAVSGFKGLQGANELYINQGPDAQGNISFKEEAAAWGLDFRGFSTQAAFFDYDRDGDLDLYLLNHSVQTPLTINRVTVRELYDPKAGDRLYENQLITKDSPNPQKGPLPFKDVSRQAGIYQSAIGYGLGVVIADLNNDGWDDIYVANDFHEDDYYYLNQGDGTFKESIKDYFGHVSRYSMGCDAADINNDGYPDVMTLDMYPQDEIIQKSSMSEDPFDIFEYKLHFGYFYQYSRNALQLSLAGEKFSDIGVMAGLAATDWSWSTLIADFDGDGHKDIFVGNGVARRPNDLDYLNYASGAQQFRQAGSREVGAGAINMMPEGKVTNYLFKGGAHLQFEDKSSEWGFKVPSLSNGAVYADLDNDGDLDLILNNLNEASGIWENRSEQFFKNNYLKVKLLGEQANSFGIGAKVYIKQPQGMLFQQLMPSRGFLSSVEPQLTFGLGGQSLIDTLIVIWPNQQAELKTGIPSNSTLLLRQSEARQDAASLRALLFGPSTPLLEEADPAFVPAYTHQENPFIDFTREPLMPFMLSGEGPGLAVGDVNGDGLDDIYVGGAKGQPGHLFLQQADGRFLATTNTSFAADAAHEDVDAQFVDVDGDGKLDLYVVSGGNEASGQAPELLDRLYLNDGTGQFVRATDRLPAMYTNTSCVRPFDFNGDGYPDLFIGGRSIARQYGNTPTSYLLINDGKGGFTDQTDQLAPGLRQAGMITDARWFDYDGDGSIDLVVVGDWMPVTFFRNTGGQLAEMPQPPGLEQSSGFWQSLALADLDGDGDLDLLVGNLGTNSKLRREGENSQLKLYVKDLDNNGTLEQIMAYQQGGKWYPVASKDELGKQLPHLKKRFTAYKDFAGKTLEEVFTSEELEGAQVLEVNRFESLYLENLGGGQFRQHFLPPLAQVSSIHAFLVQDLDGDGFPDILLGGNQHRVSTYQGRYDASYGLLLKGDAAGGFTPVQAGSQAGFLFEGEVRAIEPLKTAQGTLLLIARNNLPLQLYRVTAGRQPAVAYRDGR
jgi:enediyne biosynthesis protein E4